MAHSSAASYSPYMPPRTPVSSRARSVSAPSTPRLGYTTKSDNIHSCRNHLLHPDSNSDGSTSYASPAHKSAYGTLTTDISGFNSQAMGRPNLIVELSSPSDESCHIITNTASLCKPIAWVWIVGNIVIFGMVVFACLQPYWLVEPSTNASLGILNYCSVSTGDDGVMTCMPYYRRTNVNVSNGQRLVTLSTLPWKAGVVLYIISSILLGISSLLATVCLCASSVSNIERLSLAAGLQQLIAGVLLMTALSILPVGFDAIDVQLLCGVNSKLYSTGNCSIGWSYLLSIICCILTFTLPVLSHYIIHVPRYKPVSC